MSRQAEAYRTFGCVVSVSLSAGESDDKLMLIGHFGCVVSVSLSAGDVTTS